jgi:hypothetical protein
MSDLSSEQTTTARAESAVGRALANVRGLLGRAPRLNAHLSMFQTVVGLTAGALSILGALMAVPNYFKPAIGKGEVVAVVVDAKTEKAVSNATVEILTLNNAVVTTVNSGFFGKASSTTCRWCPARLQRFASSCTRALRLLCTRFLVKA